MFILIKKFSILLSELRLLNLYNFKYFEDFTNLTWIKIDIPNNTF